MPRTGRIQVAGGSFALLEEGPPDGPVALLLHGPLLPSLRWARRCARRRIAVPSSGPTRSRAASEADRAAEEARTAELVAHLGAGAGDRPGR